MDPQIQFGVCYAVITVFCMVFGIMILAKANEDIGSEREIHYFRGLVTSFVIFCFTDAVWCFGNFGLIQMPSFVLYLLSTVSTAALAFACFYWYCYGETRLGGMLIDKRWKIAIAGIPLVVLSLLYVTSYWTHLMFYYVDTPSYRMQSGPLYAGSIAAMALYILVVSIHSAVRARSEKSPILRREFIAFILFALTPIAAGIFDSIVPNMPVIAPSLFTSLFFVFLTLQESQIFNDSLTGLNNRRRADDYLANAISNASEQAPVNVFMIDINFFKEINDLQGHIEGDHALQIVADTIRKECDDIRSFVARWGGDEFMVVVEKGILTSPADFAARLKDALSESCKKKGVDYPLAISIGYAQCNDSNTRPSNLVARADTELYSDKQHALEHKKAS